MPRRSISIKNKEEKDRLREKKIAATKTWTGTSIKRGKARKGVGGTEVVALVGGWIGGEKVCAVLNRKTPASRAGTRKGKENADILFVCINWGFEASRAEGRWRKTVQYRSFEKAGDAEGGRKQRVKRAARKLREEPGNWTKINGGT